MLRNPGPAISALATPSAEASRSANSCANSRGFMPAFLASCSAMLVA